MKKRYLEKAITKMNDEKANQIIKLKAELKATDYKVIKNYEFVMAGFEPPYNIEELHAERQLVRDEINGLEE